MARKVRNYTVTDEGRDKGKVFVLTEMPALRAEAWAARALLALIAGNVHMPAGIEKAGFAGLAQLGIRSLSGLKWEAAEPLLSEMLTCVQIMPSPSVPSVVRPLIDDDIEEITTLIKLRKEIWDLHTDFLHAGTDSTSVSKGKAGK
jgi:hypothetical protein